MAACHETTEERVRESERVKRVRRVEGERRVRRVEGVVGEWKSNYNQSI